MKKGDKLKDTAGIPEGIPEVIKRPVLKKSLDSIKINKKIKANRTNSTHVDGLRNSCKKKRKRRRKKILGKEIFYV